MSRNDYTKYAKENRVETPVNPVSETHVEENPVIEPEIVETPIVEQPVVEPEIVSITRASCDGSGKHTFKTSTGKTYEYSNTFGLYLGGYYLDEDTSFGWADYDYAVYTDAGGYVLYVERVPYPTKIGVAIGGSVSGRKGSKTASVIYFDDAPAVKTYAISDDFAEQINSVENNLMWVEFDRTGSTPQYSYFAHRGGEVYLEPGKAFVDDSDYLVNSNTQIILRVPDDSGKGYTYLYFDGMKNLDGCYQAEAFQYFVDNECDLDGSGRYYGYIYADAVRVETED